MPKDTNKPAGKGSRSKRKLAVKREIEAEANARAADSVAGTFGLAGGAARAPG